jgi:Domain of unknown function (DUF1905)
MSNLSYNFTSELFVWSGGQANWYFIRMPVNQSKRLREHMDGLTNGFGSIRVEVTIEESTWRTSVFPESSTGSYLLPVKKQIRKAAEIEEGDPVEVFLTAIDDNHADDNDRGQNARNARNARNDKMTKERNVVAKVGSQAKGNGV